MNSSLTGSMFLFAQIFFSVKINTGGGKTSAMELLEAGKDDVQVLAELWHSLAEEMEKYSELNEICEGSQKTAEKSFREILDKDEGKIFLIKEGEIAGYTSIEHGRHESRKISRYTEIIDLFVKKDYRSQGIGSETVEEIKSIADQNDSEYLKVSAEWKNSRARKFYTENGFKEKQVKFVQRLD